MSGMKRKKKPAKAADRHKSMFMVRLPMAYKERLQKLLAERPRPITWEIREALDKHLAEKGV